MNEWLEDLMNADLTNLLIVLLIIASGPVVFHLGMMLWMIISGAVAKHRRRK